MRPGFNVIGKTRSKLCALLLAATSFAAAQTATPSATPAPAPAAPVAQTATPVAKPASAAAPPVAKAPARAHPVHYTPTRFSKRAIVYYESLWGIDSLTVRAAESGEIIRFSYRVLDPDKAAQLNDKKADPLLNDPKARVQLVVPSLEKVGKLRQSSTPIAGKSYWMAFSNPGRHVKPGDHVSVVIGKFRAEGLLVE
jgi:hypothetical protein